MTIKNPIQLIKEYTIFKITKLIYKLKVNLNK